MFEPVKLFGRKVWREVLRLELSSARSADGHLPPPSARNAFGTPAADAASGPASFDAAGSGRRAPLSDRALSRLWLPPSLLYLAPTVLGILLAVQNEGGPISSSRPWVDSPGSPSSEPFSSRADEVDRDAVRGELVRAVQDTVQPAHASLWLRSE
jgi:hypothetical protein